MGVHHRNDLALAEQYIKAAARAGADAVKVQAYRADWLVTRTAMAHWQPNMRQHPHFLARSNDDPVFYRSLRDLCEEHGVDFLATPFDLGLLAVLPPMRYVKIASGDITYTQLLDAVRAKGTPVLLSTGGSTGTEIATALRLLEGADVTLLHCVLCYPTKPENANLQRIDTLRHSYPDCRTGYSCHVPAPHGIEACAHAVALGADVVEKHFTLDRTQRGDGDDHAHAVLPGELALLRRAVDAAAVLRGDGHDLQSCEAAGRVGARRSLVAARDIFAGERVARHDVKAVRPGTGMMPDRLDWLVGKKLTHDVRRDAFFTREHLS